MMNQGGVADTTTSIEKNSTQSLQIVNPGQGYTSSYYTPSGENGILSYPNFHQDQHGEPPSRNVQDGSWVSSVPSTSNGAVNVPQGYTSYTTHTNTDHYGYGTNGYAGYYSGYQQPLPPPPPPPPPPIPQYSQPVGAYQNTGAPHQSLSSFPNTGSYAGPSSYSNTYYNTADYQTAGGYASGGYNNQTTTWPEGNYASYGTHSYTPDPSGTQNASSNQYPSDTPDPNGTHNANVASNNTSSQYQQHYKQWADYYSQTEVCCAPGTENVSVSNTSNPVYPVPVTSGYPALFSQPPAPYVPPWRPDSSSELPQVQTGTVTSAGHDSFWTNGTAGYQNHNISSEQPQFQKPIDSSSNYQTFQDNQTTAYSQPGIAYPQPNMVYRQSNIPYPATPQVTPNYMTSLQTPAQTYPPLDSRRVSNLQIPTNPRIVSNVALGLAKTNKENSAVTKPAYISVSLPKADVQASCNEAADSILKPGMFPKSLRGYVERALARCKDDTQKEACQSVLKEIIIKATADGSITRDWDIEPLFPIPTIDVTNKDRLLVSSPMYSLSKSKRSPSRRSKSRWEPVLEEKPVNKVAPVTPDSVKYGGLALLSGSGKKVASGNVENKSFNFSSNKKFSLDHRLANKSTQKPFKRQRFNDNVDGVDYGEASSDSDKEQSLTAYYSSAMALADSPDEKKKREHRSKRFEKGQGRRTENNHYKPKGAGAGNYHSRRAIVVTLSKNFEEGGNRAVEDIDWDSLTVKGTCQEIEKRYLRLTSAPDPATVRPEEVLEKALLMVQNSQKNYLYKCDQLKSIRQDLTVQRIRNELTVKVYETHARLAIEAGDLSECNQCQSQLKTLYAEGIKGCHMEFSAYDLLRVISHSSNNRDLLSAMSRLSIETKRDEAVKHALAVRAAVTSGNYVMFFRLYKTAPNLNMCLMDLYVEKMRYSAVKCMSRSCRPTVPVSYIAQLLGFSSYMSSTEMTQENESDWLEECAEWLKAHGACLIVDSTGEKQLDSKASSSTLYMPEPEDAVAHGDTTLAVNDFLAKNIS